MSELPDCLGWRAERAIRRLFAAGVPRVTCVQYRGFRNSSADCMCVVQQSGTLAGAELLLCPFKTLPQPAGAILPPQ